MESWVGAHHKGRGDLASTSSSMFLTIGCATPSMMASYLRPEEMHTPERNFADEARELEAALTQNRQVAVARLRALHEDWTRALLGLGSQDKLVSHLRASVESGLAPDRAAEAAAHLASAEQWQWEIGTWSSGSGEGLSSMFEVRTLQLARAWLLSAQANAEGVDAARALALQVENDPNDIAAPHRKHTHALLARLNRAR
ncbi:hypothetical protein KJ682_17755 [bacterium]|nr:hypothetical protein [bacterium]